MLVITETKNVRFETKKNIFKPPRCSLVAHLMYLYIGMDLFCVIKEVERSILGYIPLWASFHWGDSSTCVPY